MKSLNKEHIALLDSIFKENPNLMDYSFEERVLMINKSTGIDTLLIEDYLVVITNPEKLQKIYEY